MFYSHHQARSRYTLLEYASAILLVWLGACNIAGTIQAGINDGNSTANNTGNANVTVAPALSYALLQTSQQRTECVTLKSDGGLEIQPCQASDNQFWNFDQNRMRNLTGPCIATQSATESTTSPTLTTASCNASDATQNFSYDGNTSIKAQNYCLDLTSASTAAGTALRLQSCSTALSSQNFNWDIAVLSAASSNPNLTHGSGKYTTLAWSDEFNGTALDSNVWAFEINCDGGGNNEAECYTQNANNLFLNRQGHLVMQILKAANLSGGKTYSSARINTQNKQNFLYGRLESRLQIPIGMGMWPAFWTMPTDSVYGVWPTSGELDIMEVVGRNPNTLYGSAHFGVPSPYTQLSGNISDPNIIHGFHTYALERDANQIRWYYDDHLYFTANTGDATFWPSGYTPTDNTPWPFEQNFFVIFNIAIGGSFGGSIDPNIVGDAMVVDWVRIYQ